MNREQIVLSALPFTAAADAPFHVSIHVAPKLTPAAPEAPLAEFAVFSHWAAAIAGTTLTLRDQSGVLATARVAAPDPSLWDRVFAPDTPVRRPGYGDLHLREWRSFPVRQVHDLAALTAIGAALWFPTEPPSLAGLGRGDPLRAVIDALGGTRRADGGGRFREDVATKLLDEGKMDGAGALGEALTLLHRARRFYEPRGGNVAPAADVPPLAPPRPDFHERVAHLSDQPELLRRLGLVIDLRVDDPARLRAATMLSAGADLVGVEVVSSISDVERLGDRMMLRPRTKDWNRGRLRLGEESLFAALAMDSDGAAMKLGNFVRALPRMLAMADRGDPGHAAPPTLRSEGFTIVRTDRAETVKEQAARAAGMAAALAAGQAPRLCAEDVTQGFRVEVWDDHEKRWFSVHRRLATATLANGAVIYADRPELGWVQTSTVRSERQDGTGDAYLHEALFGWSGWSLSAPRPGPRAEPTQGAEGAQVETVADVAPTSGITPVAVVTRVAPGTLPRLRYGRSYAFRAWGVDLAGNAHGSDASPQRGGRPGAPRPTPVGSDRPLRARPTVPLERQARAAAPLVAQLRQSARAPSLSPVEQIRTIPDTTVATPLPIVGVEAVDRLVASRRAAVVTVRAPSGVAPLADHLRAGFDQVSLDLARPSLDEQLDDDDRVAAEVDLGDTITPKLPFLRWDPVLPPVVVPRHRFSPAESVHHLVIRSDVAPDGTPAPPSAYIEAVGAALAADWRATSERHLAAPKGSQHLNELHGRFDAGIDDPAQRQRLLAAALRDDGTLYDRTIVAPDDPASMIPQPGVSLEAGPEVTTPETDLDAFLGANRGRPIPAGHYVVHDVDQLRLPWLPDPLAVGWALGMPGANRSSPLLHLFRTESTAGRYGGAWPAPEPVRLVLDSAATDATTLYADGVLTIALPPGTRLDLRLSSSLLREDLALMALWNLMPPALRAMDLVERPAADGQFWSLTPHQPITLVHAVPRPVLAPFAALLLPLRPAGATHADLAGVIDIHAPSTDRIEAEARWTEQIDDLSADAPTTEEKHAVAFTIQTDPDEDMVLLGPTAGDEQVQPSPPVPGLGPMRVHRARHQFGDTRHRRIRYAFRGTTRFREYFPAEMLATVESRSRLGAALELVVPSSAEPPVPEIDSVIPLMRWDEEGAPGQPFGFRRRRRSGLRIYLKRPWFRTGADEQLAVVLGGGGETDLSLWGADPVWLNAGPETPLVALSLEDLYAGTLKLDDRYGSDDRVSPAATMLVLPGTRERRQVSVVGYRPEYNRDRGLWYVDVAIEPGAAIWPFVQLVVARYQPHALPGLELSKPVRCDFAQLLPERTLTVTRPDEEHVRVTVTGPVGLRDLAVAQIGGGVPGAASPYPFGAADVTNLIARSRRMIATIERRAAGQTSDMEWEVVAEQELSIGGASAGGDWAWTGVVPISASVPLRRPADEGEWRVAIREIEYVEADPDRAGVARRAERTPYLDHVVL
ncbi:hypothetical protein [Sphingomonas sp. BK580]|uniref:hypothetical protein n=1 Tax=Sphingomonas sp. BK580 TaxID=2586972 RepID=UPI0016123D34|nr:hypothetical protein [Sphingomonas sp. BK580]MBB3695269.1 hypothetical protein [Sphingomonas sp. BK580]